MDARRLVALLALGLVGALVVALVATDGDGDSPAASPAVSSATTGASASATTTPSEPADVDVDLGSAPAATDPTDPTDTTTTPTTASTTLAPANTINPLVPELDARGVHPPLLEIDGWLQSDVESLEELRGKVVAVQFWTFGCRNCKATLPHMQALYEKYPRTEFEIVGIHAPEFSYEEDPVAVEAAAADLGVTWPIALDTEKRTFRTWQTERRFWPRIYLLDRDGEIRYDKIGEGRYDEIDAAVGALISEDV